MGKGIDISGSGGPLGFPHREEVRTEPADVKADSAEKIAEDIFPFGVLHATTGVCDAIRAAIVTAIAKAEARGLERAARLADDHERIAKHLDLHTTAVQLGELARVIRAKADQEGK